MNYVPGACGYVGCVLAAILFTAIGCGAETGDRLPLSGKVQFNGQPLEQGTIEFASADRQQQTGAVIQGGTFDIPATQGLPPGEYIVRISSAEEGAAPPPDQPPGPESINAVNLERIPAEFNSNSKLKVELSAEQTDFQFEIPN